MSMVCKAKPGMYISDEKKRRTLEGCHECCHYQTAVQSLDIPRCLAGVGQVIDLADDRMSSRVVHSCGLDIKQENTTSTIHST